jgi:hypothetical protein
MRQDQWQISLTIDGVDMGVWDTFSGGAATSSETKYRPGGLAKQRSLGGQPSVDNITVGKLVETTDWDLTRKLMAARVGKAEAVVSRQPLDTDGAPWGEALTYRGTLMTVNPGDTDSNATAASVWQCIISTTGDVS